MKVVSATICVEAIFKEGVKNENDNSTERCK